MQTEQDMSAEAQVWGPSCHAREVSALEEMGQCGSSSCSELGLEGKVGVSQKEAVSKLSRQRGQHSQGCGGVTQPAHSRNCPFKNKGVGICVESTMRVRDADVTSGRGHAKSGKTTHTRSWVGLTGRGSRRGGGVPGRAGLCLQGGHAWKQTAPGSG